MLSKLSVAALSASILICASAARVSDRFAWAQAATQPAALGFQGVLTYHNDNSRTGQNLAETSLTPVNVKSGTFGKLISYPVDGLVYAQPLYVPAVKIPRKGVHNVVYVASEHDSVYAFDADGLASCPLWQHSFLRGKSGVTPIPARDTRAEAVGSEIGITSTPVIDSSSATIYVVAATKDKAGRYAQRVHALSLATGAEKLAPKVITATIHAQGNGSNNGVLNFTPLSQLQRAALLLNQGFLFIAFNSAGSNAPYHGWIFAYSVKQLGPSGTFNDSPNGDAGGISQSGKGPAADAEGNVFIPAGTGTFDANIGGPDYGNSLFKLTRTGSKLAVSDYFSPWNEAELQANGLNFGSAGPMLLPDQPSGPPHLAILGDEAGTVYVINRDSLGGFNVGGDTIVQELPNEFSSGLYTAPAYFNNRVYFGPAGNPLVSFPLNGGQIDTTGNVALGADNFGFPGAVPAISAHGSAEGIVWAIDTSAFGTSGPAVLYAYDASTMTKLYDSTQAAGDAAGPAAEFAVTTIANGKVYVATRSELDVYGLL